MVSTRGIDPESTLASNSTCIADVKGRCALRHGTSTFDFTERFDCRRQNGRSAVAVTRAHAAIGPRIPRALNKLFSVALASAGCVLGGAIRDSEPRLCGQRGQRSSRRAGSHRCAREGVTLQELPG
eukprot:scaffold102389_cov29-Tisochrysis_lutea.AAC.3